MPKTIESFRRWAGNKIDLWCLFFGDQYLHERELRLMGLLDLYEDAPNCMRLSS